MLYRLNNRVSRDYTTPLNYVTAVARFYLWVKFDREPRKISFARARYLLLVIWLAGGTGTTRVVNIVRETWYRVSLTMAPDIDPRGSSRYDG